MKIMKNLFKKVLLDKRIYKVIEEHDAEKLGPLIFVPSHKSFIDFLLITHFQCLITGQVSFICSNSKLTKFGKLSDIFRNCGAFFIKL